MSSNRKRLERENAPPAAKKLCVAMADDNDDGGSDEAEDGNHNEVQDATLLSLVDDCFFPIFDRLSLHDLCSVAQTCKRLHQVSAEHFLNRNNSKVLLIKNVSVAGDLVTGLSSEKYVDLFATSCRYVTLGPELAKPAVLKRLVNFFEINKMVAGRV